MLSKRMLDYSSITEEIIEHELDKLNMTETQKKMVKEKAEILAKHLEMPTLTIKGFFTFSLIEWQKMQKMTAAENELTTGVETDDRIKSANEIFGIFRKRITRVLKAKGKLHLLDKAIEAALSYYIEKYASRPRDTD